MHYLLLPDSATAPSAVGILTHTSVAVLPMEGNSFRSAFRANLPAPANYVVYATIRKGRLLSEVSSQTLTTGQTTDTGSSDSKGDGNQEVSAPIDNAPTTTKDTTAIPVLEPRGTPQTDLISLAVIVNSDQIAGTLHYLYFTESKRPTTITPQELVDHRLTGKIPMNGATIKKFNFPATSKTKYYIYAVLELGGKLSRVVLLERTTV